MKTVILSVILALIFFGLLYSVFKTKSYKHPKQIIAAITGALLLVYLLYTCYSDDQ